MAEVEVSRSVFCSLRNNVNELDKALLSEAVLLCCAREVALLLCSYQFRIAEISRPLFSVSKINKPDELAGDKKNLK
jgi:hypothetical protein